MTDRDPLLEPVYASDGYKPFGQFTLTDVQARASELSSAANWGPMARVAGIARGWSELGRAMQRAGAATVSELEADATGDFARRLLIVPPW